MIEEFLKSQRESYMGQKFDLTEERDLLKTRLHESRKFLDLLIRENGDLSSDFEFSPRGYSSKNEEKIKELRSTCDSLTVQLQKTDESLSSVSRILHQIDLSLKELAQLSSRAADSEDTDHHLLSLEEGSTSTSDSSEKIVEDHSPSSDKSSVQPELLSQISSYCNAAISVLPADPIRARLELLELMKILS